MDILYGTSDDKVLFHRLREGDRKAFDAFYRRHFKDLFRSAFRRLRDAEACKDIIQDIFTDLWFRREQISNENPVGYLHTAVRFQVFKYIGRSAGKAFYEPLEAIMPAGGTASDPLDYKELLTLVEQWMDTLPEKRGEIFRLRYQEQLSTKAIAAKLHISQKTVQNQLGIAYNSLRDKLPGIIFFLLFDSAFRHIF